MNAFDAGIPRRVIYQLTVRTFGNTNVTRQHDGTLQANGVGKFADINEAAMTSLKALGITDVWLTGVLRQATLTDYSSVDPRLAADDADIVKGRAGSYYAVRDYFDVSPDYAMVPQNRMAEFEALVERFHAAGLKVHIDLVSNHVGRSYASVVAPEHDFGRDDDTTAVFSTKNDFFYVPNPQRLPLTLEKAAHWNPTGAIFDHRFAREDGTCDAGRCNAPRVTGEGDITLTPSANSWYETVKLNYGFDFRTGNLENDTTDYAVTPSTWPKMDAVIAHWQSKGVDGFRCDFAHIVPTAAWKYLITQAKQRKAQTWFFAEAYASPNRFDQLFQAGFDAIYYDDAYDTLKRIYQGKASRDNYRDSLKGVGARATRYLFYLENHDERRLASPIDVGSDAPDNSGFGSATAARQVAPLQYLATAGPLLIYNGQETGEPGAGAEGFGGEDGRTSIFDYWSMPTFTAWVGSDHGYREESLPAETRALRAWYRDLLKLAQDPSVRGDHSAWLDADARLYALARYSLRSGRVVLVAANFSVGASLKTTVRISSAVLDGAGISGDLRVRRVLDEKGATDTQVMDSTASQLSGTGLPLELADQVAHVFVIEKRR